MAGQHARIAHLDIARAIGILLVILGHALVLFVTRPLAFSEGAYDAISIIYAVHMPLFFFLSGLTHRPKPWKTVITASLGLIFLAQLSQILGVVAREVLGDGAQDGWPSAVSVVRSLVALDSFSIGVTWFLVALAVVRILAKMVLEGRPAIRGLALALAAASLVLSLTSDLRLFQIQAWWAGLAFYLAGAWGAPVFLDRIGKVGSMAGMLRITALALISGMVAVIFTRLNGGCVASPFAHCSRETSYGHFYVRMIIGDYGFLPWFVIGAAIGSVCVLLLSADLARLLPDRILKYCGWIGQNTLTLLLLNGFFLALGNGRFRELLARGYNPWLPLLLPIIIVCLHLLLLPFFVPLVQRIEKLANRVAAWVIGLCWSRYAR